jgi:hypothetical protein
VGGQPQKAFPAITFPYILAVNVAKSIAVIAEMDLEQHALSAIRHHIRIMIRCMQSK